METNFKGTHGRVFIDGSHICSDSERTYMENETIFDFAPDTEYPTVYNRSSSEAIANAKLVIDAFNVRQQINVDLPELLEQRNELLEMLKHLLSLKHAKDMDGKTPYYLEEMPKAWGKAKDLITKIERIK